MKIIWSLLSVLVLLTSCRDKENNPSSIYIGAYRIMDQMVPYPYIIQQKKDSIYLFNNKGILLDEISGNKISSNSELKFKDKKFHVLHSEQDKIAIFDLLDTLNFKTFKNGKLIPENSAKFSRVEGNSEINIKKIQEEITSSIWKYDVIADDNSHPNEDLDIEKVFHFKTDSLDIITNYYYQGLKTVSEYDTKAYNIFEIDSLYFLSFQKEDDNPQPIYQIIAHDAEKIELKDFSSRIVKNIRFVRDSMDFENYKDLIANTAYYSNCFDGYQGEYYYGDNVTYNKGNNYLVEYVNRDAPKTDTKSGYIIVHFNVNCQSVVGNFGLIQMDREFKQTAFSKEMVSHILEKVSQLTDFPSSYSQKDWLDYKDVHAFLMFKLEKGKIVDLCP